MKISGMDHIAREQGAMGWFCTVGAMFGAAGINLAEIDQVVTDSTLVWTATDPEHMEGARLSWRLDFRTGISAVYFELKDYVGIRLLRQHNVWHIQRLGPAALCPQLYAAFGLSREASDERGAEFLPSMLKGMAEIYITGMDRNGESIAIFTS